MRRLIRYLFARPRPPRGPCSSVTDSDRDSVDLLLEQQIRTQAEQIRMAQATNARLQQQAQLLLQQLTAADTASAASSPSPDSTRRLKWRSS